MLTDACGEVSVHFTNKTVICNLFCFVFFSICLQPVQETYRLLVIVRNGVNTNLMSRSVQTVLTNFLVLRSVMLEKGPIHGNLKYNQLQLRTAPCEEVEMK